MSKSEHRIQDEIRLALSPYGIVFRLNSGKAYGGQRVWDNHRCAYILTHLKTIALCPTGTSDLLFIGKNGKVAWIECKDEKGKLRPEQEQFLKVMREYGYAAGVARSPEDALRIIGVSDGT